MKKVVLGFIVFCCIMVAQFVGAASIDTTFGWQQDLSQPVVSWDVFRGPSATGPWTLLKNQPYYVLSGGATEYLTTTVVVVTDNAITNVWFKAQTIGTNGLRSGDSTIISKAYDTRTAPTAPGSFNVK